MRPHYSPMMIRPFLGLVGLILIYIFWQRDLTMLFLIWNLFLALLPLYFSKQVQLNRKFSWVWAGLWLLFFPNAAYLITDLVHLQMRKSPGFWLDAVILFSSGMFGIFSSLISLNRIETWYRRFIPGKWSPVLTLGLLLLTGYGIYLGRIERWNSWDIILDPFELLRSMAHEIRHPLHYLHTWVLSSIFSCILGLAYLMFRDYRKHQIVPQV